MNAWIERARRIGREQAGAAPGEPVALCRACHGAYLLAQETATTVFGFCAAPACQANGLEYEADLRGSRVVKSTVALPAKRKRRAARASGADETGNHVAGG